jgi:succinyl-diaminopimelate desuccinylase
MQHCIIHTNMVYNITVVQNTDLIQTLTKLIAIPSISADAIACHEILAHVSTELIPYDLFIRSDVDRPNPWLLATTRDTLQPDILLAAHLDVVPAPAEAFTLRQDGERLYGRGTYDMKSAVACYLELLRTHHHELAQLNIGFLFTTDEELGGASMQDIIDIGLKPGVLFIPDGGDNWHVESRAKGSLNALLTVQGRPAHGSRPWEGDNALHRLMDALSELRAGYPSTDPSEPTLAVTMLDGGEAVNQIPAHAAARIDFRAFEPQELSAYKALLTSVSAKYQIELDTTYTFDPLIFDKQSPAAADFLATLEEFTGKDVQYTESYGGTDGRYFAPLGVPCIIVQPRGDGRHAEDEWVDAADLHRYYQLLEQWLLTTVSSDPDAEADRALVVA